MKARTIICALLVGVLSAGAAAVAAQAVSDGELAEHQARIRQRMASVEQRLLEMADLIEADQPDRAERLRRSLQLSRERLIVPGMQRVGSLLAQGRYAEAAQLERQILEDLSRLADLLNAEQWAHELDRLREAAERLDGLVRAQSEALERTRRLWGLSQQSGQEPAEQYAEAAGEQARLSGQADALRRDMRGLPGADEVASALAAMADAAAALSARAGEDAVDAQATAGQHLEAALARLRRAIARLEAEHRARALQTVRKILQNMLREQKAILTETEAMERTRKETGGTLTRAQSLRVLALASREDGLSALADDALAALEQDVAGLSLPAALGTLKADVGACADMLRRGRTGFTVQELQRDVIGLLEGLIQALADAETEMLKEPAETPQTQKPGEPERRDVDAAMELSIIRAMQVAVNQRTVRLDDLDREAAASPEDLSAECARLAERQRKIRSMVTELRDALQRATER